QAEDGIRDDLVTGVQTCALPISPGRRGHPGGVAWAGVAAWAGAGGVRGGSALCEQQRASDGLPPLSVAGMAYRLGGGGVGLQDEIGRASCRGRGWSRWAGGSVSG